MGSEIDSRPLIHHLIAAGLVCVLPVMGDNQAPLRFHRWSPGDPLHPGPFGTQQPASDAPQLAPQLLLLPLLAFDAAGHRLGYGGGYYDRTLKARRGAGPEALPVTAVGLAFAGQMVETVPVAATDEPLDWVVTQTGARRFRAIL
jgi:5-formyltetrahydrofolate cyclo-ligase